MKKKTFIVIQVAIGIYCVLYLISTLYNSDFWGNILSPIGTYTAAGILFYISRDNKKSSSFLYSLAALSWAIADTVWAFYYFVLGIDPNGLVISLYFYMPTYIFLISAVALKLFRRCKGWHTIQKFVDTFFVLYAGLILIWVYIFQADLENVIKLDVTSFSVFLYLVFDTYIVACILSYISSIPLKKAFRGQLTLTGLGLFILVDIFYSYQAYLRIYNPNSMVDFLYVISFIIIAYGQVYQGVNQSEILSQNTKNFKIMHKIIVLLLVPAFLVIFNRYNKDDLLLLLFMTIIYVVISNFIAKGNEKSNLLVHEKKMNDLLEKKILDRTQELLNVNAQLNYLVKQDTVTDLYNRRYFMEELDKILKECSPSNQVIVIFADLDRFKAINDAYGHEVGDNVLGEFGRRLNNCNSSGGIWARFGGDEFIFAASGSFGIKEASEIAENIIACCKEVIMIDPYELQLEISMGITFYPRDAAEASNLIRNADMAMYSAKQQGGSQYAFFNKSMNTKVQRETTIEMNLKKVNYSQEFELYYQPQFRIADKALIGAEALIRWNSPVLGFIMPDEFITLAEENGVIIPLGDWILNTAAFQIKKWNTQFNKTLKVGVNVSGFQLYNSRFIETLKEVLNTAQIPPDWINIEITESTAIGDIKRSADYLKSISDLGFSISIDDFGTGYSSFSILKQYPIGQIKIAKSLVNQISEDKRDADILKAIIMMAKAIGTSVIAEGVELQEQVDILNKLGCDELQGYVWGRPVPKDKFEQLYLTSI